MGRNRGFRQEPTVYCGVDNQADFIRQLRRDRGWTQHDLCERIPEKTLSVQSISDRERGRVTMSPGDEILYAKAFGIPVDKFREQIRAYPPVREHAGKFREEPESGIPVINSAPGGVAINYEEYGVDSRQGFAYLPRDPETMHQGLFAVIVVGESMVPTLTPGDLLVLHPLDTDAPDHLYRGRTVFVRMTVDEGAGCCLARWEPVDESRVKLVKDNPKHKSRTVKRDTIERVAVAVQLRRKVK